MLADQARDDICPTGGPERHYQSYRPRRITLRPCDPRNGGTAQQGDELAPPHSITSSAVASIDCGMVRTIAFAVLRFMTSSYLVGACTGISAGFSPFRMRSTYPAACRTTWCGLGPYEIRLP